MSVMPGASLSSTIRMVYLIDPVSAFNGLPPLAIQHDQADARLTFLRSPILFLEENVDLYNTDYPDGLFASADQIATRHGGTGNISLLDGSAMTFRPPQVGPEKTAEAGDLMAKHFYAGGNREWIRTEGPSEGNGRPFGWFNNPTRGPF
jgi:prepilin-type processing-associated H-X9-DG protein